MLGFSLQAHAASCPSSPPPVITVITAEDPIAHDNSWTDVQLTKYMRDHGDEDWEASDEPQIKGMFNDHIDVERRIAFAQSQTSDGLSCLSIAHVDVTLHLRAKIYIAKGYDRDPDYFRRIFTHEDQRLNIDRSLMTSYAPRLKDGLAFAYSQPSDYALPPLPTHDMMQVRASLTDHIDASLKVLFQPLIDERGREQHAIDVPD